MFIVASRGNRYNNSYFSIVNTAEQATECIQEMLCQIGFPLDDINVFKAEKVNVLSVIKLTQNNGD